MSNEKWNGKRVAFLGDSITFGSGLENDYHTYRNIMKRECGIIPFSYAFSGAVFSELYGQAKQMDEEMGKDIDAIFIFVGTNDYYWAKPIGEWYTTEEKNFDMIRGLNEDGRSVGKRIVRTINYDDASFRGSINKVLEYIKKGHPDTQVILMTPIHRSFATFHINNYMYDEHVSNAAGLFLDDYVKVVKEAANVWATELIDLNAKCGLLPSLKEYEPYFTNPNTDLLHPSIAGHRRIADVIEANLDSIPLFSKNN